jgi:hypothetical protein
MNGNLFIETFLKHFPERSRCRSTWKKSEAKPGPVEPIDGALVIDLSQRRIQRITDIARSKTHRRKDCE